MTINNLKSLFRTNNNAIICKEKLYTQTYELSATESHNVVRQSIIQTKNVDILEFVVYSILIDFCGVQQTDRLLWSTVHGYTFVVHSTCIDFCGLQYINLLLWSTVH